MITLKLSMVFGDVRKMWLASNKPSADTIQQWMLDQGFELLEYNLKSPEALPRNDQIVEVSQRKFATLTEVVMFKLQNSDQFIIEVVE